MTFKSKQFSKYCACWGKLNKFEVSFVDEFHRGTFLTSRASEMIDRLRYAVINCKRYIRKTLMESWRYPGKFTGGFVQFYLFYGIAQFSLLDIDIRMKNKKEKEKAYRSHRWKLSVFFFFFFNGMNIRVRSGLKNSNRGRNLEKKSGRNLGEIQSSREIVTIMLFVSCVLQMNSGQKGKKNFEEINDGQRKRILRKK